MFKIKSLVITLLAMSILFGLNTKAFAEQKIGLVDIPKILNTYTQAQKAQAELKQNQKELEKMLVEAGQKLKTVESEKAKEKLQKEFAEKIMNKNNSFKATFQKKWDAVEQKVLSTIKQVADKEGYTLIVEKQSVIAGGDDITDKVLSALK